MLKDLLRRMPGMEITEDGKVKFNGEEIDKLTVGGRTFFFNDQSTALNNLPAAVVDKIRVIDRESEATRATGLEDGSREKVLDVALKKEYEKGWFGNVGLKAGTTLGDKDDDNPLRDDRGLLWNGNALLSAYGEKDQLTVIANGQNIDDSNVVIFMSGDDGEMTQLNQGLSSAAQVGVNANSSRIKGVESTAGVSYKYTDTDSGSKTERTTYQADGNLNSSTENSGKQYANAVSANMELEKEEGKVWFHFRPAFNFSRYEDSANSSSETSREGTFVNRSENATHSLSTNTSTGYNADITVRDLWGKKGRSLQLSSYASYDVDKGNSDETSLLTMAGGKDIRAMRYDSDGRSSWLENSVTYTEPLGGKWMLSPMAMIQFSKRDNIRDAFDAAGRNDYYSSVSRNNYIEQQYGMTVQYKFSDQSWITLGGRALGLLNETYSKSYGIEETNGKDEWNWHIVPNVRFQYSKGMDRLYLTVTGYSDRPYSSRMLPVLNITDPSRLSLGNVYLRPYTQTFFSTDWTRNNTKKFSTLMVYLYSQLTDSPISYARWYDTDGILYSIPVNSQKPSLSMTINANYTTPLDTKKNWSLTLSGYANYVSSVSYQTHSMLPGLDKDNFDYASFMSGFWGNAAGDRFYSGKSGFAESFTRSFSPNASISVRYNKDRLSFNFGVNSSGYLVRYSLDPSVNMNTLDTHLSAGSSYITKHEFEFATDIEYAFYKGYANGYGQPEWRWNAEISKNIGAFNLSVKIHDILNQTRNLTHTVTANYEEDSYRLIMGRYILFGIKWNFGKMNASHSQRAQDAMWNMLF
jgi:hypothetical protein